MGNLKHIICGAQAAGKSQTVRQTRFLGPSHASKREDIGASIQQSVRLIPYNRHTREYNHRIEPIYDEKFIIYSLSSIFFPLPDEHLGCLLFTNSPLT